MSIPQGLWCFLRAAGHMNWVLVINVDFHSGVLLPAIPSNMAFSYWFSPKQRRPLFHSAQSWAPPSLPLALSTQLSPLQGICMLFPREDLPLQVWDKSSAPVLLWLIRTPQFQLLKMRFPAQLLGFLMLWVPGKDGGEMRRRMRGWALGATLLFVCLCPHVRCIPYPLQKTCDV